MNLEVMSLVVFALSLMRLPAIPYIFLYLVLNPIVQIQKAMMYEVNSLNIKRLPFPLGEILEGSLYYPGSGIDGTPIRNWSLGVNSFVYVDMSWSQESYQQALSDHPVYGYHIVAQRELRQHELAPNGYNTALPASLSPQEYKIAMRINRASPENAFALWSVFQRDFDRSDSFGPERFSLLHIRAEGVAAYEALYVANGYLPKILAFIRPGLDFGGNYRMFEMSLIEVMERSPRGVPRQLLWEHACDTEPSLREPWSSYYRRKILGPLKRDDSQGHAVTLFEAISKT